MSFFNSIYNALCSFALQPASQNSNIPLSPSKVGRTTSKPTTPHQRTAQWLAQDLARERIKPPHNQRVRDGRIQKPKKSLQNPRNNMLQSFLRFSPWARATPDDQQGPRPLIQNQKLEHALYIDTSDLFQSSIASTYAISGSSPASPRDLDTSLVQTPNGDLVPDDSVSSDTPTDYSTWTPEETQLWRMLNRRGQDPLIDYTWHRDFPTCPPEVFETDLDRRAFICATHLSGDYRASRALLRLFEVGGNVRARLLSGLDPTPTLAKEVQAYFDWSMHDCGSSGVPHISVLDICEAVRLETPTSTLRRATDRLREMARLWRELQVRIPAERKLRSLHCQKMLGAQNSRPSDDASPPVTLSTTSSSNEEEPNDSPFDTLPTLYSILVTHSVAAFLTLDASNPDAEVKSFGTWDFKHNANDDVWHALAIAILIVSAREDLRALREEGWFEGLKVNDKGPDGLEDSDL